ncbi:MAG: S-layer homology domain-containing protein [Clostridia bacterium]|nr:S-layer homology domain-containing protein [Clostridia bacterium]
MSNKKKWMLLFLLIVVTASLFMAAFSENHEEDEALFSDVSESDWFYMDVAFVKNEGLMQGTGDRIFSPQENMTRAMLVTILWRMEGEPMAEHADFSDVPKEAYYRDAVAWGYAQNIVSGYSASVFAPNDLITREQMATIFYRYAAYKQQVTEEDSTALTYEDAEQISPYAVQAIAWAVKHEILTGVSPKKIAPQDYAKRCEAAAIFTRFCKYQENFALEAEKDVIHEPAKDSTGGNKGHKKEESESLDVSPILMVDSVKGRPGDTVQVAVRVKNNPGILGMVLTAHFDEEICVLKSVQNGDAVKDVLDLTTSRQLTSGTRFVWDGLEILPDNIQDGTILMMDFIISETAKPGEYPISLTYTAGDVVDNALQSIALQIESGRITIEE